MGYPEKLWMGIPGSVKGRVGWGFVQPGLMEGGLELMIFKVVSNLNHSIIL